MRGYPGTESVSAQASLIWQCASLTSNVECRADVREKPCRTDRSHGQVRIWKSVERLLGVW